MKKIIAVALFMLITLQLHAGVIGEWTIYPAYSNLTQTAEAGNKVYFLSSGYLYSVNTATETVECYDKTRNLSDSNIKQIAWCQAAKRLLILYTNYNIDLLEENGDVINISDYYSKAMIEDKTVNRINVYDEYAYLCTGFGIIKLNMKKAEISDTYNLGFSVDWCHLSQTHLYAESADKGQYGALLKSNMQDKNNWTRTGDYTANNVSISSAHRSLAEKYKPAGPTKNEHGVLYFAHNRLYSLPGWGPLEKIRMVSVQIKNGDEWTYIGEDIKYLTSRRFNGGNCIVVDNNDPDHFYVGARSGLFEFKDNKAITEYYFENCPMEYVASLGPSHINYTMVTGMYMDEEDNVWCLNSSAPTPAIYKLSPEKEWTVYKHDELYAYSRGCSLERAEKLIRDSRGLMWFVNERPFTNCMVRYDVANDKVHVFDNIHNQDGAVFGYGSGRCVVEDREGNIWFGTDTGLLLLPADNVMTNTNVLEQVKVPRNDGTNLADYLMSGVDITCMQVDGGNRKWIGTNGQGVYVISSDNMEQVHHFTASNSPLLTDKIESMVIDEASGEVYFGTEIGLCSYTMDSTMPAESLDSSNIYAYPNPVTRNYTGPITITGLTYNADIKIVTASGQLVAKGTSNGGTFVWDGTNLEGKRVASGVYMVLAATEDGKSGTVCKIAIVR